MGCSAQFAFSFASEAGTASVGLPFEIEILGPSSSVKAIIVSNGESSLCGNAVRDGTIVAQSELDAQKRAVFTLDTVGIYRVCVSDNRQTSLADAGLLQTYEFEYLPKHLYKGVRMEMKLSNGVPKEAKVFLSSRVKCDVTHGVIYGPVATANRTAIFYLQTTESGYLCLEWPDTHLFTASPSGGGTQPSLVYYNIGRVTVSEPFEFSPSTALRHDTISVEVRSFGYADHSVVAFSKSVECTSFVSEKTQLAGAFGVEVVGTMSLPEGEYYLCIEIPKLSGEFLAASGVLSVVEYRFAPTTVINSVEEEIYVGGAVTSAASLVAIHDAQDCTDTSRRIFGPVSTAQYRLVLVLNSPGLFSVCIKEPARGRYILAGNLTVSDKYTLSGVDTVVRGVPTEIGLTGGSPLNTYVRLAAEAGCEHAVSEDSMKEAVSGQVVFRYLINIGAYFVCVQTPDKSRWIVAGKRTVRGYILKTSGVILAQREASIEFERSTPESGLNVTFVWRTPNIADACLLNPSQIEENGVLHVTSYPKQEATNSVGDIRLDETGAVLFPLPGMWDLCSEFPTPSVRLTFLKIGERYAFKPRYVIEDTPVVLLFSGAPKGALSFLSMQENCAEEMAAKGITSNSSVASIIRNDGAAYFFPRRADGYTGLLRICVDSLQVDNDLPEYVVINERLTMLSITPLNFTVIANLSKDVFLSGPAADHKLSYVSAEEPKRNEGFHATYKILGGRNVNHEACQNSNTSNLIEAGETAVKGRLALELKTVQNYTLCVAVEVSPYLALFTQTYPGAAAALKQRDLIPNFVFSAKNSNSLYYWMNLASIEVSEPVMVLTPEPEPTMEDVSTTISQSFTAAVVDPSEHPNDAASYDARYNKDSTLEDYQVVQALPFSVRFGGSAYDGMPVRVSEQRECTADVNSTHFFYDTPLNASNQATLVYPKVGVFYLCVSVIAQWVNVGEYFSVGMSVVPDVAFIGNIAESNIMQIAYATTVQVQSVSFYFERCPERANIVNGQTRQSPIRVSGPFSVDGDGFFDAKLPLRATGDRRVAVETNSNIVACGFIEMTDAHVYLNEHFFGPAGDGTYYLPIGAVHPQELPLFAGNGFDFDLNNRNTRSHSSTLKRFTPWRVDLRGVDVSEPARLRALEAFSSTGEDTHPHSLRINTTRFAPEIWHYMGVYVTVRTPNAPCNNFNPFDASGWQDNPETVVKGGERRFFKLRKRQITEETGKLHQDGAFDTSFTPEDAVFSLNVVAGERVKICSNFQLVFDVLPSVVSSAFHFGGSTESSSRIARVLSEGGQTLENIFKMVPCGVFSVNAFISPGTFVRGRLDVVLLTANLFGVHNVSDALPKVLPDRTVVSAVSGRLPVWVKVSGHVSCNTTLYGPVLAVAKGVVHEGVGDIADGVSRRAELHGAWGMQFYADVRAGSYPEGYLCVHGGAAFMTAPFRQMHTPVPTPAPDLFAAVDPPEVLQGREDQRHYVEVGRFATVNPFVAEHPVTLGVTKVKEVVDGVLVMQSFFDLRVHVPPEGELNNIGVGNLVKITNDSECSMDVANGGWQKVDGVRNASFALPIDVTGTVYVCVATADASNWARTGYVILLGHVLPMDALVKGVAEVQTVRNFEVASGYLTLATVPDCGSGLLNVSEGQSVDDSIAVSLLSLPIVNATVVVPGSVLPASWPDEVWGCVSGVPAGRLRLVSPPQFALSYAPVVVRNRVKLSLTSDYFSSNDVFLRVLHDGVRENFLCDESQNFTLFDANHSINNGLLEKTGAHEYIFTPYQASGGYLICAELRNLKFRLRVAIGTVETTPFFTLLGGVDVVESTQIAELRPPQHVMSVDNVPATWNITVRLDSCDTTAAIVRPEEITRNIIRFTATNNTLSTRIVLCVVNGHNGGWFPFDPSDVYSEAFTLQHHWEYTLSGHTIAHHYASPVNIANVLQDADVFLIELPDDHSPFASSLCNATRISNENVMFLELGSTLFRGGGAYPATYRKTFLTKIPSGNWGVCVEVVANSSHHHPAGVIHAESIEITLPPVSALSACIPIAFQISGAGTNTSATSLELRSGVNSSGECCSAVRSPLVEGSNAPALRVISKFGEISLPVGSALTATFLFETAVQQNLLICLRTTFASETDPQCLEIGALGGGVTDTACYTPAPSAKETDRRIGGAIDPVSGEEVKSSEMSLVLVAVVLVVVLCLVFSWRCFFSNKKKKKKIRNDVVSTSFKTLHIEDNHTGANFAETQTKGNDIFAAIQHSSQSVMKGANGERDAYFQHYQQAPQKPVANSFCSASNPAFLPPLPKVTLYEGGPTAVPSPRFYTSASPRPPISPYGCNSSPVPQLALATTNHTRLLHSLDPPSPHKPETSYNAYGRGGGGVVSTSSNPPLQNALPPFTPSTMKDGRDARDTPYSQIPEVYGGGGGGGGGSQSAKGVEVGRGGTLREGQGYGNGNVFAVPASCDVGGMEVEMAVVESPIMSSPLPPIPVLTPREVSSGSPREEDVVLKRRWGALLQSERDDFAQVEYEGRTTIRCEEGAERQEMEDHLHYQQNVVESLRQRSRELEEREQDEQLARLRQTQNLVNSNLQAETDLRAAEKRATEESDLITSVAMQNEERRRAAEQKERGEQQAHLERERERAAQREAEEGRRERAEAGRHIKRHQKDLELEVHRALGRIQREEAKRRRAHLSEEEGQREKLVLLADDAGTSLQSLLKKVEGERGCRQHAEHRQRRDLLLSEEERREAHLDAEHDERRRLNDTCEAEGLKRMQIQDLLARQHNLEAERKAERGRLEEYVRGREAEHENKPGPGSWVVLVLVGDWAYHPSRSRSPTRNSVFT